jgi:hypothetical protein
MMKKKWSKISLIFLFLVALIGTLLRSAGFIQLPLEYQNLVHAHSHVAFQGWVYLVMLLLLTDTFLEESKVKKKRYPLQFKLTVLAIIGVLVSFSLQGYGLYSIIFSTLFQLLCYWFIFSFLADVKHVDSPIKNSIGLRFVKTGLWLGLISTILPYAIGIISAKGLNGTELYKSLVYAFMHLQYNGWFLFVILGLFFSFLDRNGILYNHKYGILFYWLFTFSVIPAVSLSLLGMEFSRHLLVLAYLSSAVMGMALIYFILTIPSNLFASIRKESSWFKIYFLAFLLSFIVKIILQCLSVFPFLKTYAFYNKPIIIGYLHLSLIGSISFLLLALLIKQKWLVLNGLVKIGSALLIMGFATTELLLMLGGLGIFHNQIILIIGSAAMAIGVLVMIMSGIQNKMQNGGI